ncbi:MAG: helix-turn-helix domain-containing protein [Candidatus Neomarinimicrobiota bacterium]
MDNQEPFFHDLKQLRVAQGITLEDIASKTRINQRFLEALENGEFSILPKTYIRLFLRSYCQEIGSNFPDVAQDLEEYLGEPAKGIATPPPREEILGTTKPKPSTEPAVRSPATLRRDFVTGAVIFVAIVVIIVFARRTDLDIRDSAPVSAPSPRTEQPASEPPATEPATPAPRRTGTLAPAPNTRPVVPAESTVELDDRLFSQDRLTANLQERVRLTPPVRLTLMARDNVVIQPYSEGRATTAFNLTVAEARQWIVTEELILRTPSIHLLRGDLNGVPLDFGEATGLGVLRITSSGVYEVSSYATPE